MTESQGNTFHNLVGKLPDAEYFRHFFGAQDGPGINVNLILLFDLLTALLWITFLYPVGLYPILHGIELAKRNNISPNWMWFGVNPISGWIAYLVIRIKGNQAQNILVGAELQTPILSIQTKSNQSQNSMVGAELQTPIAKNKEYNIKSFCWGIPGFILQLVCFVFINIRRTDEFYGTQIYAVANQVPIEFLRIGLLLGSIALFIGIIYYTKYLNRYWAWSLIAFVPFGIFLLVFLKESPPLPRQVIMRGMPLQKSEQYKMQDNTISDMEFAGFWRRVAAFLVDSLVLILITIIAFFSGFMFISMIVGFIGTRGEIVQTIAPEIISNILGFFVIIFWWLYFAMLETSKIQGTLGKKLIGIRVTDLKGNTISFGKASGRFFAKFLSIGIAYIGFLMAGWTSRKQALHDMVSGCLVLKKQNTHQEK